jgi:hypothetical protein
MTVNRRSTIMATKRQLGGADSATVADLPKNQSITATHAAERSQGPAATWDKCLSSGIMASFDDNAINGFVAFAAHR